MENILLFDGNNLLHRSFHGIQNMSTSEGKPTNAIFGLLNTILKYLDMYHPKCIAVAFDNKAPNFRRVKFPYYKATRNPIDPALLSQFDDAKECVRLLGFNPIEIEGLEADDILGCLSKMSTSIPNSHTFIISGDRDLFQLIDDHTTIIQPKDDTYCTLEWFNESYGITPSEFIDVKSLMGDKSDNIPGAYGIGEKGAIKLIQEFHNIDAVYENIDLIKGSLNSKLSAGKSAVYDSKWLATISTDSNVVSSLEEIFYNGYLEDAVEKLKSLELFSILRRSGIQY